MKRSRLKRKTSLERSCKLKRSPIKPVNSKRKRKRYAKQFGDYADTIRGLPCDLCQASAPSDPHHVRTRAAGGTKRDMIPLCRVCHTKVHDGNGPDREHLTERAAHYWTEYGP